MTRPAKSLHLDCAAPGRLLSLTVPFGCAQPAGRWWNLAELFGFANGSELDAHALLRLAHGRSPDGERVLADVTPGDGVELVFNAPASVATLWATLEGEGRASVEQCHREAVAYSLQATEWRRCAFQAPLHARFLPTPADLIGALFAHAHDAPEPDLHTHCLVLGATCARAAKIWGRLHRGGFADHVPFGAFVYERLLAKALKRRLGFTFEPRRTRWAHGCRSARRRTPPQPAPCPRAPTARRGLSLVPGTGSDKPANPDRKERRASDRFEHHPTPVTASVLARTAPWSAVIDEEWSRLQEEQACAARFAAGYADEAPAPRLDPRIAAVDAELLARPAARLLLGALAEVAGLTLVVGPLALDQVRHAIARIAGPRRRRGPSGGALRHLARRHAGQRHRPRGNRRRAPGSAPSRARPARLAPRHLGTPAGQPHGRGSRACRPGGERRPRLHRQHHRHRRGPLPRRGDRGRMHDAARARARPDPRTLCADSRPLVRRTRRGGVAAEPPGASGPAPDDARSGRGSPADLPRKRGAPSSRACAPTHSTSDSPPAARPPPPRLG